MAKLILSMDGLVLKEITLTKERTTVGRKPHNDIQIDNLAVSGEHAVIVTILNDSFLEDLGSTNGTLVNGQPIKKHFLQNNDVIELGKYKLKYMNETSGNTGRTLDFEKTMVLKPGGAPRPETPMGMSQPMAGLAVSQPQAPLPSAWVGANASQPMAVGAGLGVSQAMATASGAMRTGAQPVAPAAPMGLSPAIAPDPADTVVTPPANPARDPQPGVSVSQPMSPLAASMTTAPAPEGRMATSSQPYIPTRANPVYMGNASAEVNTAIDPQAASRPRLGAIQILTGSNAGRELELVKPLTTLGKPQVQVAVITKRPNGYFITHVEGTTYPVLNGKTLDAQAHALNDHDIIEIAGVKMEFYLK